MNKSVFNGLVHLLGDLFYTFAPLFIKKGAIGGTFHHLIDKYFWICYINADAISGYLGSKLFSFGVVTHFGYKMGNMAARYIFALCSISFDEVYAKDTGLCDGGGAD